MNRIDSLFFEHAARSTEVKLKTAEAKLAASSNTLQRLQAQDMSFTYGYFSSQWERQRECQLAAMEEGGVQERLEKHLIALLDMEEEVKEAYEVMKRIDVLDVSVGKTLTYTQAPLNWH